VSIDRSASAWAAGGDRYVATDTMNWDAEHTSWNPEPKTATVTAVTLVAIALNRHGRRCTLSIDVTLTVCADRVSEPASPTIRAASPAAGQRTGGREEAASAWRTGFRLR